MTSESFRPAAPEPDELPVGEPVEGSRPAFAGKTDRSSRVLVSAVLGVALAVLVGGIGFAAGRATAPAAIAGANTAPGGGLRVGAGTNDQGSRPSGVGTNDGSVPGGFGGDDGGRRGPGGQAIEGKVSAVGAGSITITLADGRSATVATDSSTGYHRQGSASASDVTAGSTVIVSVSNLRPNGGRATPTAGSITIVP